MMYQISYFACVLLDIVYRWKVTKSICHKVTTQHHQKKVIICFRSVKLWQQSRSCGNWPGSGIQVSNMQLLKEKKTQKGSLSFSVHLRFYIKDLWTECFEVRRKGNILLRTHCGAFPTLFQMAWCALCLALKSTWILMTDITSHPQRPPFKEYY